MKASVILAVACACSFEPQKSGLGPGEQLVTLVEDTEVELASRETLSEGIVTPGGTIEPHAFVLDGLRARAYQTAIPLDEGLTTFADVETALAAAPQTARRTAYGQLPVNWGGERPRGLGLISDETFTIIFDGELALVAGDNLVEIDADDAAILELDSGGGFTNTVVDSTSGRKSMTVNVPADGWYPVRAAIKETSGNARLELFLEGALVTPQQLRAKVTNDQGLIVKVFDSAHTPPRGTTAAAVVDSVFGMAPPPYDLADVTTTYDLRFVGQIYIDTAGSWTLAAKRASPLDAMRLWIDGKRVASAYADSFSEGLPEVATLELAVGWHDLAVDLAAYQSFAGIPNPHNVGITLTAIPPGGVEVPVTTQMLRPAVASNLASAFLLEGSVALRADAVTPVPITVPAIDGAVIDVVDVGYFLDNVPTPADFTITLDTGTPPVLPIPSDDFGYVFNSTMFAGQPLPATPWTMHFADTIADSGPAGAITFLVFVDFSCHGGAAMPFAPQVTYVSSPLETPNALRFAAVRVKADLDGATATVSLRTAPSADALASAAWVDVVDGQPPAAVADAFVQYRITTTSDGWKYPVIDAVELDYVAPE